MNPPARRRSDWSTVTSRPLWRTTCSERAKRWQSPSSDHIATANSPPIPYWLLDQRPTARLTATEALQVGLQRSRLDGDGVDHPIRRQHPLPAGRADLEPVVFEQLACLRPADRRLRQRHPVLIQLGVDPLHPRRALIDQRLVQPHPFPPLQHDRRRDPRLRQPAVLQQLAQQPTVAAIGLGAPLATTRRLRVGRLRQVRLEPSGDHLLDDVTPTGATLHRHRHRRHRGAFGDVVAQPPSEPLPVGLPHPPGPHLTGLHLQRVERDLPSMQIQPTYHRHREPPSSSSGTWQTEWLPEPEPAGFPHMGCFQDNVCGAALKGRRAVAK